MATNSLCLSTLPSTPKDHNVKLTVVSSKGDANTNNTNNNVSLNELMNQICAMMQLLHFVEGELALNQSQLAEQNNQAAQLNIAAVTAQGNAQISEAEKAAQAQHRPWWETLLMVVFAVVMIALSYFTFGITAAILAAVIIVITTVPLPFLGGQTLTGFIASKIAQAIGKSEGWSDAKIQEVTGYINLAIGIVLAIASAGIGFAGAATGVANAAATIAEDVVEEGIEMADMAANTVSTTVEEGANVAAETAETTAEGAANAGSKAVKAAAFSATNAFVSQVANSNCFTDIIIGTLLSVNPNASDTLKEVLEGLAVAISVIVAILGAVLGGSLAGSANLGAEVAEEGSSLGGKISALLAKIATKLGTTTEGLIAGTETATGIGQGALNGFQGGTEIYVAYLQSEVTRLAGELKGSEEISQMISATMNQINAILKAYSDEYSALLGNIKNIGMYGHSEVDAMLKANQTA